MIGGDACPGILVALASRESWCVTVNGLSVTLRSLDLLHHFLVASQHTRVVHHLCEETNILASHELCRILGIDHGTAGFNITAYGRYTAGGTEAEANLMSGTNHIVDALNAQHVANFVWVGNDTYRAVTDGNMCKLMGHHHTALNMYVTINEARHYVWPRCFLFGQRAPLHLSDRLALNNDFTVEYLPTNHVNDMSLDAVHSLLLFEIVVVYLDAEHDGTACSRHQIGEEQRPDNFRLMKQSLQHKGEATDTHHQEGG